MSDRREAAIEAAARVDYEEERLALELSFEPWGESWERLGERSKANRREQVTPIVDAVLALGCDRPHLPPEAVGYVTRAPEETWDWERDPLPSDESNPAGVNVTTPGPAVPGSSEGRPTTGAPLDADEAVPAPAGQPAEDAANDSRGIPPEPPSDARGSDLRAAEGGEAVGEGRESAGPGDAQ